MSNIKKIINDNLIDPITKENTTTTLQGVVTNVNEKANTCSVRYVNVSGKTETRDDVPVFVYNKSVVDWFPDNNDKVLLQERDRVLFITGPASQDYSKIRSTIKLENDIFSDTLIGGIGGYLF